MRMLTTVGLSIAVLIVSATAWAKQAQATHHHPAHSSRVKSVKASEHVGNDTARNTKLPPQDRNTRPMHSIGPREVGTAAWYGGRHIGGRTASGERLDAIHPTAAHRTLPLHSLVRVTNLSNGRSAICTINDRGPVSRSLLIDLSPRMADELDMRRSGLAHVSVEPIAEAATGAD